MFSGNTAVVGGGLVASNVPNVQITNCTFTGNKAIETEDTHDKISELAVDGKGAGMAYHCDSNPNNR